MSNTSRATTTSTEGSPAPFRAMARRKQAGMAMIGMAIILGIITILTLVTLAGLKYFTKAKVYTEVQSMLDFETNIVGYGARVGQFTAINSSLQALINQNFFSAVQVAGTSPNQTVSNQWGGSYTVAVGTIVNAGDSIVRTSTSIPASVFTELGTSLDSAVSVISINGTATKAAGDNNSLAMTVSKR